METIITRPDLYDLLYGDVTEDIELYLKLTEKYEKILEYGAGTGRITIPLINAGHRLVALDLEDVMLEKLKNKIINNPKLINNIEIVHADMATYCSNEKFDCIIIPLTSFNYLTTLNQQKNCIENISNNLKENGIVILELLSPNTFLEGVTNNMHFIKKIEYESDKYYEYWRNTHINVSNGEISQNRLFKLFNSDGYLITEETLFWNNKYVSIEDFKTLIRESDLVIDALYGNCQLEEYNNQSPDIFIKLKKIVGNK
jgi:SAM-dependent methyltransferase